MCGELDLPCRKSQNQKPAAKINHVSVSRVLFYSKKHSSIKTPTFGIAVIWRHRTGKEKERKTFIKQHADQYWPLHVVTMQGAKHRMQVIFRDLRDWRRKTLIYGKCLCLGALAFCLWADRGIPRLSCERLGILKVTSGKFGLAREKIKYVNLCWWCGGRRSAPIILVFILK